MVLMMIFWSFGVIGFILSQFENKVLLKPVLGVGVGWGGGGVGAALHQYITAHKQTL